MKNQRVGGIALKGGGAWSVSQFKGGVGKKEGVVVFLREGGCWYPMHTMVNWIIAKHYMKSIKKSGKV